jgi:hypothetical protein
MTTPRARIILALAAVALLLPLRAEATLAEAKSFDDKVENAASIVVGKCVSTESRWDNARRWILTYNRFEIEKALKGSPAREVTIVTPGGVVGNIQQDTVGVPKFAVGEEHVLFVRNTAAGPTVLYFEQGSYQLIRDSRGDRTVVPAVSSIVLIDTQAGRAVAPEEPTTLRAFESRVRDTIKRREAVRMEMIEREKEEQASIMRVLERNKALVVLALIGAVLATWQLIKRW